MPLAPGVHYLQPTIPVHVFEATEPGPTAVVQAGIHGDEIAGVHAVEELLEDGYTPRRGRLLLIPVMNPPAYRVQQRTSPGGLDLNRSFPGDPGAAEREPRLANQFMALMLDEMPEVVITLHESWKRFHPDIRASFAQTIIYGVKPMPPLVGRAVDAMNEHLEHPYEQWAPHYYPVDTASSEVIAEATGCIGLCVETWMGFDLARRVAMQREVVERLLTETGVR